MDNSDLNTSSNSNYSNLILKRKACDDVLEVVPSKRARFNESYHLQSFSIPNSFVHYMTKDPKSASFYQKTIMTCKFFFVKNPILVVSDLKILNCEDGVVVTPFGKYFDMCKTFSKIWVTENLSIDNFDFDETVFSLKPKMYRCDAKKCVLILSLNILFKNFFFLVSIAEEIHLEEVTVINNDETVVILQDLVRKLPNLKIFDYQPNNKVSNYITSKTVKELLKLSHFSSFDRLRLSYVPEVFDIEELYKFIKGNNKTMFALDFNESVSEAYKNRLQTIVNEITETENHSYKIPIIRFPDNDAVAYEKLYNLVFGEEEEEE